MPQKTQNQAEVVVRFPPSPTGDLHIGNIRTFLFNYLFARKHGGKIVMRFEDTDRERSKKEYEDRALTALEALGLDFDEGPFRQSERTARYQQILHELIAQGKAYEAEENAQGTGKVVRLRNPNKTITFTDVIRGEISIDTTQYGDFVIARSIDDPLYHLTVVVDDFDMGVTHVIRGEDHITSTPRQLLLIEALGAPIPTYAHLPLIVGADGKKLSKRHGAVTFFEFQKQGIIPEALVNYLALLGWAPGDDREIFTLSELIDVFSLERVNNSPARFDYEKLNAINREHLLRLTPEDFQHRLWAFLPEPIQTFLAQADEIQKEVFYTEARERTSTLADIATQFEAGEWGFLFEVGAYAPEDLIWKKSDKAATCRHLQWLKETLSELSAYPTPQEVQERVWPYAEKEGRGDVLWPLRYALTGQKRSPDPFTVFALLGRTEALSRLEKAVATLGC